MAGLNTNQFGRQAIGAAAWKYFKAVTGSDHVMVRDNYALAIDHEPRAGTHAIGGIRDHAHNAFLDDINIRTCDNVVRTSKDSDQATCNDSAPCVG